MTQPSFSARLADLPIFERRLDAIDGHFFNHARLALRRLGNPTRLSLEGLRGLDFIIEDHVWVCVDRTLNDIPVLAWVNFNTSGRSSLHGPVHCELRFYHCHAGVIRARVLETMERFVAEHLATDA